MSEEPRTTVQELDDQLEPEDQEWLKARIEEYAELLDYLHDH